MLLSFGDARAFVGDADGAFGDVVFYGLDFADDLFDDFLDDGFFVAFFLLLGGVGGLGVVAAVVDGGVGLATDSVAGDTVLDCFGGFADEVSSGGDTGVVGLAGGEGFVVLFRGCFAFLGVGGAVVFGDWGCGGFGGDGADETAALHSITAPHEK